MHHLAQADVVASVLALAPTTRLIELELDSLPDGSLLRHVLHRFPGLQAVSISPGSQATGWGGAGLLDAGSAVVTKLRKAALDLTTCDRRLEHGRLYFEYFIRPIDGKVAQGLQAATRLQDLSLALRWSDDVAQLCTRLPGLRKLRWGSSCASVINMGKGALSGPPRHNAHISDIMLRPLHLPHVQRALSHGFLAPLLV